MKTEDYEKCRICGKDATDSTMKGYCQDCIDESDEAQDKRDNSSCYSIQY